MKKIKLNSPTKAILFRLYDLLFFPLTVISAFQMWLLRRYGIANFPFAKKYLFHQGVFPIRRHFYEPLFHPDDLPLSFADERALPGIELNVEIQLERLHSLQWQEELKRFSDPTQPVLQDGTRFRLDNNAFNAGDIDFYYQLIRQIKPRRIIEIGSGHSTIVAISSIEQCQQEDPDYTCEITAIEPYPWFRHSSLRLLESKVEDVSLDEFKALEEGDILFIDSSHMLRPGGDVEHEFLRILPLIKPGVIIHVHDIFTPFHYPEIWVKSWHHFWNEQYVLEALMSGGGNYEVYASLHFLSRKFPEQARCAMPLLRLQERHPHSFWIRKVSGPQESQSKRRDETA